MSHSTHLIRSFFLLCFLSITAHGFAQADRSHMNRQEAEKELQASLSDTSLHNVANHWPLIKDSSMAVAIAELILFSVYGEGNIVAQKPYDIHHIRHYWVLTGTLPTGYKGGTFLLILDETNGQVIRLTHGK